MPTGWIYSGCSSINILFQQNDFYRIILNFNVMLRQDIYITVDCLVFSKGEENLQLLLVKRKYEPHAGKWAFPGGFVEEEEELDAAAMRELQEETGMELTAVKQLHTFGKVGRDTRCRTVTVVHYAIVNRN